ncbi:MAG TPA: S8 family serine peptidase [Ohtaekwangia sp.]
MKYIYVSFQRSAFLCLIVLWLMAIASSQVYAQQKSGFENGVVRIKVSEALASHLENTRMTKSAGNVLVTGIQSIDRVNVQFKATGMKRVFRHAGKFEAKHRKYGLHRWYEIQLDKAASVLTALSAYQQIDQIEIVQPLYKKAIVGSDRKDFGPRIVMPEELATLSGAPNDPLFAQQWHYDNTGQAGGTPGSDISILQAWGIETGNSNVIVAVTDGGAQVDHPDLVANMWVNTDEVPGNGIDDDSNGYVDDINGYGFGDDTGEIAPDDHGTHTSGTIAATTNNGIGVAGVAGGSGVGDGVRIMSCAAFGAVGVGGFEDTYVYAADNGALISQNSWGYTNPGVFDQAVLDGIDYFIAEAGKDELGNQVGLMNGGIVIFSAGNDDDDGPHYPGFYESTLAVSGVTNQDKKAWYSNFGEWVDLAAPGGETFVNNDPRGVLSTVSGGNYAFFQGTSMACPHVSGVAALIISKFGGPGLTPEMVRGRLTQLVDDIDAADPPFAGLLGSGRLNAFLALQENDGSAPEAIDDLAAAAVAISEITLTWTAPADAGNGSASVYDIRYSTSPITEGNFGSATQWPSPPVPQAAGSPESVTITGLLPGTVYYFAIKSADFFGNFSSVSNIVEQATNFAPVISVSPTSLVQNLQTAGTASQTFTITNNGLGVLDFALSTHGGFAEVSPVTDTLAPGSSTDITVTFSAAGLLAGTYQGTVSIFHNDPLQDSLTVGLTLNVTNNGLPIASVEPDSLDFGDVFETDSVSQYIYVHNAGSEPLAITGVSSDNSDFIAHFSDTVFVAPFATAQIQVTFVASSLGVSSGFITISTNDPANTSFTVAVRGNGVVAPGIVVTPDALSASLNTGNTETQTLTIENTGGSNLEFSVGVSSASPASVASVRNVVVPVKSVATSKSSSQKASASGKYSSNQIKLKSVGKSAVVSKLLIVTPDDDVTALEAILNGFDDIQASTISADSLPLLSLAKLNQYDIVLTTNNTQWLGSGGIDPADVGDLLADYIDAGGKVIVNQFAYSYDAWQMAGRFIDDGYGPFTPSTTDAVVDVELGTILSPGHPILEGVNDLAYSGYVQNVGLASGAIALAEWDNGELFLAANAKVVALNMLPDLGNGDPLQWAGDLPTIYQNAVHYLQGGGSFVTVSPAEGVVAPGEQVDLEVTFDASGLDAGVYTASIDISSNAPNNELISVPATLTVLGPEFTVSPDSLYDELERQQTSTHTIFLNNNGPDDHTFTVSVEGAGFSTSSVKINKPALASGRKAPAANPDKQKQQKSARKKNDRDGIKALSLGSKSGRTASRSSVTPNSTGLYTTDFENLSLGDIDGQEGWYAEWGNWTVSTENPYDGAQHFSGLSDGFGFSLSLSPSATIGSEPKSTVTMKVNLQSTDVSWQIAPQSPSAGFVVTRIGFETDGSMTALVSDGAGGGFFETIAPSVPSGYFDLTIEADRATAMFDVYINETKIFTGLGFTGDIEQVAILSWMEEAGSTLDIDDFQIIDGTKEEAPTWITASPLTGNLPSGATAEITVTFTSGELEFGLYSANVNIEVDGTELTVPAKLRVIGDEAIDVDPTVLEAVVDYKGDTTKLIHIANTGGKPLTYGLQVIGAGTDLAKLPPAPVNKFANWPTDKRIADKKSKDDKASKPLVDKSAKIELLAGSALLDENFDGGTFPPAGWSVTDLEGEGVNWSTAADAGEGNYSGTGEAATVSSDVFGLAEFDAVLVTPSISTAGYKNIAVQYNANYANYANLDFLDLDIQVDGGAWTTVLSWNEDHGTFRGTPGEFVSVSLASYIGTASSFRLRWHYYDPNSGDWDWYAQIDDVVVLGDARSWLTVEPAAGTVPVGESVDIAATFDAEDLDPGFYVAGIIVSSNAVEDPLVGIVASLQVREPAVISVDPDSVYVELPDGLTTEESLTISNSGESVLTYSITDAPIPSASGVKLARIESKDKRTTRSAQSINLFDTHAITSGVKQMAGSELYGTGFEEFATGDVSGQQGWTGQFGNWTVETFNPGEGAQHLSGLADGLGQSRAFSPTVALGDDDISTASMKLDLDNGVTWQIIPQSPTAGFVNTRFQISADGSLSTLVQDSTGTAFYQEIPGTLPDGYFDFRIEVASTLEFTIYVNDAPIFTGTGFAGDIEQVVLYSLMEEEGPLMDVDNLVILDGPAQAPWLTVTPDEGAVPAGGSTTISLLFDATDVEPGTYTKILNISSNDPETPNVAVPVTLVVIPNLPPVLSGVSDTTVRELSSINLAFTAADPDDADVTISVLNAPAFMTLTSAGNGYSNHKVSPLIGDAGTYEVTVVAEDPRGGSTSIPFTLTVTPYGVQSFSLTYKTGAVVTNFEDSVTLDIADPDLDKYTIQANTDPTVVGSVRFTLDGNTINTDNSRQYTINAWELPKLSGGYHTLTAQAFTRSNGNGDASQVKSATIHMINSAAITDFDLINVNGARIDLVEGAVIDISQPGFNLINIIANTSINTVRSVKFSLNGPTARIDNRAPYGIKGTANGNETFWAVAPGNYTVTATPYMQYYAWGPIGQSLTVNFRVVNGGVPTVANARSINNELGDEVLVEETGESDWSIYPVPVKDELHISLTGKVEGQIAVNIMNLQGQSIHVKEGMADAFRQYTVSTVQLGLPSGFYLVQIQQANGKRIVRKFMKE